MSADHVDVDKKQNGMIGDNSLINREFTGAKEEELRTLTLFKQAIESDAAKDHS